MSIYVFILCLLCANLHTSISTGVALNRVTISQTGATLGESLQNLTLLAPTDISNTAGVACSTALNVNEDVGEWRYPNGTRVGIQSNRDPLYRLFRIRRVDLFRRATILSEHEGIYTCRIPDENQVEQLLYVGIYSTESHQGDTFPTLGPEITFNSTSTDDIIMFTLTCPSSSFPPTSVMWSRDGETVVTPTNIAESYQQLLDARVSTFDNVLRVRAALGGTYRCTVSNAGGSSFREREVQVPSGRPDNVEITRPGNNELLVTWTQPSGVLHYLIRYMNGSDTNSLVVQGPPATITGILAGVEYTVTVQGMGDLPGAVSTPVTATLITLAPPTPTLTVVSTTQIDATWERISRAFGYEVSYSPAPGSCVEAQGGSVLVEDGFATSFNLRGLEEFIEYSVVIRTLNDEGFGVPSEPQRARTQRTLPGAPVLVSAEGQLEPQRGIRLTWLDLDCLDVNDESVTHYIVSYSLAGSSGDFSDLVATSSPFTILDPTLQTLKAYAVKVAAVNGVGAGDFSASMEAFIFVGPGPVTGLTLEPDIVSILVRWTPPLPENGGQLVTAYEVTHRLSVPDANPIRRDLVNGSTTSLRVTDLLPDVSYNIIVLGIIEDFRGDPLVAVLSTRSIGRVLGVNVTSLSDTSVRVSWRPLASQDISAYRVYYSLVDPADDREVVSRARQVPEERSRRVPVEEGPSVVIEGLEEGGEYQFQVVASVVVNDAERTGEERSGSSMVTVVGGLGASTRGLPTSAIAGIIIGCLAFLVLVIIIIFIGVSLWRKNTSGRYVIKKSVNKDIEMSSKEPKSPTLSTLPLPDFEPFVPTTKPQILQCPLDTTAMEGQKVILHPRVSGAPPPTIAWYHNGSMVSPDYAVETKEDGSLVFVCVELKHAGTYRFTVSNSAGSIQGQVQLKVYSEDDSRNGKLDGDRLMTRKVAVKEFGYYVEELHADSNKPFREQFFWLANREDEHRTAVALEPENKPLNRFTNITVYDDNRIKLKTIGNVQSCQREYINACYINGYFMGKKFVATQGPLDSTVVDFWRLVWQLRTPTIVMITNLTEGGKLKCTRYWPDTDKEDYGPFRVFLTGETVHGNYTIRSFHVNLTLKTQNPLKVVQYHFTAWPDHGVPEHVAPMLAFHRRIKAEHKSMLGPMLVHCSAGVGRSGTFMALDIALQQASGEDSVDIPAIISNLRNQRMKMVQTMEQYVFLHDAVLESLMCGNTQIPIHEFRHCLEALHRRDPSMGISGFQSQFQVLEQMSPKPDQVGSANAKANMKKNRYTNYLPSDKHRVVLKAEHPDYIHATFANGYKQRKKFIITQGPLRETCRDFWKMVYERNCPSIVMLSGMMEDNEEVCYKYWPTHGIEQYGEYDISLLQQTMHDGFLERIYSITDSKSGQAHRVSQLQVINWDQHGVTFNMMAILNIIHSVNTLQRTTNSGPIVVHCSDTVTRSGIFCAVANTIECCQLENMVDIFQVVKVLRTQRPGAIPTVEQYQIIHDFVAYYIQNMSE